MIRIFKSIYVFVSLLIGKGITANVMIPATGCWRIEFGIMNGKIAFGLAHLRDGEKVKGIGEN